MANGIINSRGGRSANHGNITTLFGSETRIAAAHISIIMQTRRLRCRSSLASCSCMKSRADLFLYALRADQRACYN